MNDIRHIQDLNVERSHLLRSMEHDPSRKLRVTTYCMKQKWIESVVGASCPGALAGED